MKTLCLNDGWRLHEAPLNWGPDRLASVLALKGDWMDANVPCDIHTPLEAAGKIKDVVLADYSFDAEWTEHRSWWFVKTFDGADLALCSDVVELSLESLDAYADVFLNGEWLGTHKSAHFPFVRGVKELVRGGENVLAVRLTTGMEQVSDQQLSELGYQAGADRSDRALGRHDHRRSFVRKAQYTVGWDWGPKALTCGIVKDVCIRTYDRVAVRGVYLTTTRAQEGGDATIAVSLEVEQLDVVATRDADIRVRLSMDGAVCAELALSDVLLTSGINYIDEQLCLPGARLWWPSGYGEQPLYRVEVEVNCDGVCEVYPAFDFGVRTLKLDTSRTDLAADTRLFALIVNGVRIYCKGGDWIPSDSIYARVSAQKYATLISEAKAANFNMLRIWGGGCYEYDLFYRLCDRAGILLWHDFMFACSLYPDHLDWYRDLVDREIDFQTRRLRNHACIGLWSGNNEDHYIFGGHPDLRYEKQLGLKVANVYAKKHVRANCPGIPYWNSSPYGGPIANADNIGNVHHWGACMMNADMAKRIEPKEYDLVNARFVTEYGYPGPCPIETIRDYFDGKPIERGGAVWELHNNTFEKKTVNAGIEKHYLDGAADLSLDDYILYAGMVQSTMLGYSLEAMRFKDFMSGSLFWMYNDTWGEVGWTIVDYYLRRKISFYGVRRAFAPVKLTLREAGGRVKLQGANDSPSPVKVRAKVGYLPFDGSQAHWTEHTFTLAPRSREYLLEQALPEADYTRGAFVVLPEDGALDPAVLRLHDVRALQFGGASVTVLSARADGDDLVVTLTADRYAHGVHIKEGYRLSDNYFDLLPGQIKTVVVEKAAGAAPVWHKVR
ncbi:MAG: beta-mannosidase [Clostridiales bacterium]|nr:beta-mannosidase [Clostridiales bacterium]